MPLEPEFRTRPLTDMLAIGAVTQATARIWIRTARPGRIRVSCWREDHRFRDATSVQAVTGERTDNTTTATLPGTGNAALEPGTRYLVQARNIDTNQLIGEGQFETAPAGPESAPERFSVAWMSCNQPFTDSGEQAEHATAMLDAAWQCMGDRNTKLAFTLGDQMYTDYPADLSLFEQKHFQRVRPRTSMDSVLDANSQEVRALLHERYRYFWNMKGWKRMHSRFPCYPAIDDHDIIDNWGCNPEHSEQHWASYIEGARAAYMDYQGSRVHPEGRRPDSFDYSLEYGPLAAFVFDLRSQRRTGDDARILNDEQLARFSYFLERYAEKDVLLIGLSVPLVHLPRWAARAGRMLTLGANEDFSDRWSTAGHKRDRDRVLSLLRKHQRTHREQQIFCISGDIHIACAHRIQWDDGTPPLTQLISSGITNKAGRLTQIAAKYSILANKRIEIGGPSPTGADVALINGVAPANRNPYTKLNLGMLEFRRSDNGRYETRALVHGHNKGQPECVFSSPWRISP